MLLDEQGLFGRRSAKSSGVAISRMLLKYLSLEAYFAATAPPAEKAMQ
jgi:hypothetical protein